METGDGVSGAACRQPGCTSKGSPVQQWGVTSPSLSPAVTQGSCPQTSHTEWGRRRHPEGRAGPTSIGSCDPAARHQARCLHLPATPLLHQTPAATAGEVFALRQTLAFSSHPHKRLEPQSQTDVIWAALQGGFQT